MAIGDRATATSDGTGTSLTYAHTVAGTTNLFLLAYNNIFRSAGSVDPTGITYAGGALTEIADFLGGAGNDNALSMWSRIAPATGANNIVVTCGNPSDITTISISYSGVDQATPTDTVVENDVTTTTPSHSVTSETDDMVVSFGGWWGGSGSAATGSLTEQLENHNGNGLNSVAVGDAPGGASVTVGWTYTTPGDSHGQMSVNLNQATVGGSFFRTVDGVQPASTGVLAGELIVPPAPQMWLTRPVWRPGLGN